MTMPRHMIERHTVIDLMYQALRAFGPDYLFGKRTTTHGGLQLRWIKPGFQKKNIGALDKYQIVIAKIEPQQTSQPHFHEIGSSSCWILGPQSGFPEPTKLTLNVGHWTGHFRGPKIEEKVKCKERNQWDILPFYVHQFENQGTEPAYVLIVTHPVIYLRKGKEDTYEMPFA